MKGSCIPLRTTTTVTAALGRTSEGALYKDGVGGSEGESVRDGENTESVCSLCDWSIKIPTDC